MDGPTLELELPGFRFHPTEKELLGFYLKNIVYGKQLCFNIIGLVNIYHHDPWDLPGITKIGRGNGSFLCLRTGSMEVGEGQTGQRKTVSGKQPSDFYLIGSKADHGTEKDSLSYKGRAPRCKSDWVMNEYRLPETSSIPKDGNIIEGSRTKGSNGGSDDSSSYASPMDTISFCKNHGGNMLELQVPKLSMDWTQDPFWNQLNSSWLQNFTPTHANILNF